MRAGRVSRSNSGRTRFVESVDQTVVLAGNPAAIIDAAGVHWTVTSGAQMAFNNVVAGVTSSVVQLAYANHVVWQKNTALDWFSVALVNGAFTTLSGPTKTSPLASTESAQGTTVTTVGPSVVDSLGEVFTITSGQQVAVGGVTDTTTANVIMLLYYNHQVYHENTSFAFYAKASASAAWVFQPNGDPRGPIVTQIPVGLYASTPGIGGTGQWDTAVASMSLVPKLFDQFPDERFAWNDSVNSLSTYASYLSGLAKSDPNTVSIIPVVAINFGYFQQPAGTVPITEFTEIGNGTFDNEINGMLAAWKSNGYSKLYLRPAWEFNLPQFPWKLTASTLSAFMAAWQRFYVVVHTYANTNGMDVKIVWNPAVGASTADASLTVGQQYPGDAYVDVIGMDSYGANIDSGWNSTGTNGHSPIGNFPTTTNQANFSYALMFAMGLSGNKPIALCETGSVDALFAQTMIQALNNRPQGVRIEFVILYPNANDWTTGAFPSAVAAWKAGFQDGVGSVVNKFPNSGVGTLALDGSVAASSPSIHTQTLTLTTTRAGVIIVVIEANAGPVTGITDSAGMTWTKRSAAVARQLFPMECWYAVSNAARTGLVISITQTGTDFMSACAFGVSGANTTTVFDGNLSLPAVAPAGSLVLSTTAPNTFMFAAYRMNSIASPTGGAGFTTIAASNFLLVEYKIVSTAQTSLNFGFVSGDPNGGVGDAILAG